MDVDPNYDPSDFLKMPSTSREEPQQHYSNDSVNTGFNPVNIKREPQSHQQDDYKDHHSFDMPQMLYEQPQQEEPAQNQRSDSLERDDLVGIHDDLAISDSDEGEPESVEAKIENVAENDNEEDGVGLWF